MDSKFSAKVIEITEEFLQELKRKHEMGNFQSVVNLKGACNSPSSWDDPFLDIYTAMDKEVNGYRNKQLTNSFLEGELVDCAKSNSGILSCDRELQTHSLPPNRKLQSMPNFEISGFRTPRKPDAFRETSTIPKCPGSTARCQYDNSHTKKEFTHSNEKIEKENTVSQKPYGEGPGQTTREPFESFRYPKLKDKRRFTTPSLVPDLTNTQHVQTDFKQTTTGSNISSTNDALVYHDDTKFDRSERKDSLDGSHLARNSLPSQSHKEVTNKPNIEEPRMGVGFVSETLPANSVKSNPPQISDNQSLKPSIFKEHENQLQEPHRLSRSASNDQRHEVQNESSELQKTRAKSVTNEDVENAHGNSGRNGENNNSSTEPGDNEEEPELEGAVGGFDPSTIIPQATPEVISRRPKLKAKRNRRKKNNNSNINVPKNQNNDNVLTVKNGRNNTESKDIKDTNETDNKMANVPDENKTKQAAVAGNVIEAVNSECAGGEDSLQAIRAENRRLKESKQCRICRDNDANRMFLPCAHLAACSLCSPAVLNCPQCKAPIRGIVSVYFG